MRCFKILIKQEGSSCLRNFDWTTNYSIVSCPVFLFFRLWRNRKYDDVSCYGLSVALDISHIQKTSHQSLYRCRRWISLFSWCRYLSVRSTQKRLRLSKVSIWDQWILYLEFFTKLAIIPNRPLDCYAQTYFLFVICLSVYQLQWNPIAPSKRKDICSKI